MTHSHTPSTNATLLQRYQALHDGLSSMIEEGRLTADDIPDDYHWLVTSLETIAVQESQHGDEEGETDLFENQASLPIEVKNLIARYDALFEQECPYKCCREMLQEMQALGYTFEYGLDGEPHALSPLT
mgnify:CR=1 FL=1|tara:strand:- start:1320 stop:1706 length:387 start_codon:yes stop_codon:yes gene_type:complete